MRALAGPDGSFAYASQLHPLTTQADRSSVASACVQLWN